MNTRTIKTPLVQHCTSQNDNFLIGVARRNSAYFLTTSTLIAQNHPAPAPEFNMWLFFNLCCQWQQRLLFNHFNTHHQKTARYSS
ncbi:hypothetical protein [Brenneria alni]|uniref:hypothetical protein n=1 Tax=Brenneria alni TaxID=71656 RepID=UPI0011C473DD|nr:hypothetical protein [Brenneria alni]